MRAAAAPEDIGNPDRGHPLNMLRGLSSPGALSRSDDGAHVRPAVGYQRRSVHLLGDLCRSGARRPVGAYL